MSGQPTDLWGTLCRKEGNPDLEIEHARTSLNRKSIEFAELIHFPPRAPQGAILDLPTKVASSLTMVEAAAGSGKTEAAFIRFLQLFQAGSVDGMFLALSKDTAATQIHRRIVHMLDRAFDDQPVGLPVIVAVPGYIGSDDIADYANLSAAILIGTIEQLIFGVLNTDRAHTSSLSLSRHLIVIDELYSSEACETRLLEEILRSHAEAGGHAIVLSTVIESTTQTRLLQAYGLDEASTKRDDASALDYPLITHVHHPGDLGRPTLALSRRSSQLAHSRLVEAQLEPLIDNPNSIAIRALEAARQGARVLLIRNTIESCVETQLAVEHIAKLENSYSLLFRCRDVAVPYHSRFSKVDRELLDSAFEKAFGKSAAQHRGRIVVASQTAQKSLDIDIDFLISDLCPMDALLQRLGKLHRHSSRSEDIRPHSFQKPTACILVPPKRDLAVMFDDQGQVQNGRYRKWGFGSVYDDIRIIEATWQLLERFEFLRLPELSRTFIEQTTHPDALSKISSRLGERWQKHETWARRLSFFDRLHAAPEMSVKLGERDRMVRFDSPMLGPFDLSVEELLFPAELSSMRDSDFDGRLTPTPMGRGFSFTLGDSTFLYDRMGLRVS